MEPLRDRNQRFVHLQYSGDIKITVSHRVYKKSYTNRSHTPTTRVRAISAATVRYKRTTGCWEFTKNLQQYGSPVRPLGQQTDV